MSTQPRLFRSPNTSKMSNFGKGTLFVWLALIANISFASTFTATLKNGTGSTL
jgi:hypothetical protein